MIQHTVSNKVHSCLTNPFITDYKGATRDFRGRASNPPKRAQQNFLNEDIAWNNIFQISKRKKYYRNFPDFSAFKINNDYKQTL